MSYVDLLKRSKNRDKKTHDAEDPSNLKSRIGKI